MPSIVRRGARKQSFMRGDIPKLEFGDESNLSQICKLLAAAPTGAAETFARAGAAKTFAGAATAEEFAAMAQGL